MKVFQIAVFSVMLAVAGGPLVSAQEPEPEKEKQKQQEEEKKKQPPPKAQPKSEEPKSQPLAEQDRQQQDANKQKQAEDEKEKKKTPDRKHSASQSTPGANPQSGTRTNVRRIPQDKFRSSFGSQHHFRVLRRDDRRFQYSGYVFEVVEVWPAGWSYDDECYIEEDGDDYYLVDVVHPETRILVVIAG